MPLLRVTMLGPGTVGATDEIEVRLSVWINASDENDARTKARAIFNTYYDGVARPPQAIAVETPNRVFTP